MQVRRSFVAPPPEENDRNSVIFEEDYPWQHPPEEYALAITGKAFNFLVNNKNQESTLQKVLFKAQIYARMSPDDKATLVSNLQTFCKTEVGMCGDGANDCVALKTADVGISLSEAEASIAAPFTSQVQNISAVVTVLMEGRCALVTSFQTFKFFAIYAMGEFISVILLIFIGSNLSDWQYLYIDLFTVIPISMSMAWTKPYHKLTHYLPQKELFCWPIMGSILG